MATVNAFWARRWWTLGGWIAVLSLGLAATVHAHDPGLSSLELKVSASGIDARMSFSPRDAELAIQIAADGRLTASERVLLSRRLGAFARDAIELRMDGRLLSGTVEEVFIVSDATVVVRLTYPRVAGSRLTVRSQVADRLANGHRQLLAVRRTDGVLVGEQMLGGSAGHEVSDLDVSMSLTVAARQFFSLGLEHILSGYDHLLFLAGLLLGVERARDVAKTATAFTAGHSLTLLCAVLGFVHVPSQIVEPLIAASIVYVGVENVLRPNAGARWKTALSFGLIHGLGFAGALQELGVGSEGVSVGLPLGSFNVGVEAGQVALAMIVWPAIRYSRARPALGARLLSACSLLVALCGAYWLIARLVTPVAVI
jgi:hydrogenase/urease accessory protein HupE